MHDFKVDGMLHGRVLRPASVGAKVKEVDESSIRDIAGARVIRINDFVGVVADNEWAAISAARKLKVAWSDERALVGDDGVRAWLRAGPFEADEFVLKKGDGKEAFSGAAKRVAAEYYWPMQSHGSMGPSCAIADVRDGKATIWSASQATHRFRATIAKVLGLPKDAVRVVYLDGSGCYGMNGHDDAAADAALLSRAAGRPVRVQWMREDEHGWDPKGPPQLLSLEGGLTGDGKIAAWRTEMWLPKATANLPNMPLLAPTPRGSRKRRASRRASSARTAIRRTRSRIRKCWCTGSRPRRCAHPTSAPRARSPTASRSKASPTSWPRPRAAIRSTFRLEGLSDPRGIEVLRRAAALIGWQSRPAPARSGVGRGIAYIHYKNNESYVAIALEAEVERSTGAIRVRRVACAHDCGLVINPDALRAQVEGNILQTLSRTLYEEVTFDRSRVTSVDWASYPILTFPEVPQLLVDLVDRPKEPPLGAGEAAATPVPAALANAVFDATGVRLRTVPFTRQRVLAALA